MFTGSLISSSKVKNSQNLVAIMEKETFEDAFMFNDTTLNIFTYFQYIEAFQVAFVTFFLLMLSLFFPKQAVLTRFINKLTFLYFLCIFYFGSFGIIFSGLNLSLKAIKNTVGDILVPFLGQHDISD
jgi:hypothetical protein